MICNLPASHPKPSSKKSGMFRASHGHHMRLLTHPRVPAGTAARCCCCCCRWWRLQDADYQAAGATLVDKASALGADLVLKVRPPALDEAMQLKAGAM